jgi:EAL domain-containing protein (putative c-di-GMP-specific phosphodiesterase class I)
MVGEWSFGPGHHTSGELRSMGVRLLVDLTVHAPRRLAVNLTIGGVALSWGVSYALGGTSSWAPGLFLLVILLAGLRFGWQGALVTSLASGILAGPLLPAVVSTGVAQPASLWLSRAAYFVALGQLMALLGALSRRAMTEEIVHLRAERDLLRALDRDEFGVLYQPIVALNSGAIMGVEALLRWEHPERGIVGPNVFIPIAEDTEAINSLGRFVLDETCRQIATWRRSVLRSVDFFHVAINVSTRQLEDPTFLDHLEGLITATHLDPSWIQLELTETSLISDLESARKHLEALKGLRVRIAIDDFGTGYSSFSYLQQLPVDVVKIDQSFVATLGRPGRAGAIVQAICETAHSLGITTVAEGVETHEQIERLRELGCEVAQGFYFSHAIDAQLLREELVRAYTPREVSRAKDDYAPLLRHVRVD